jgi:flagellar hook-associated protein 2
MSTSSTAPITFNGSSTYASAFQQVITRAVGIASLPMQMLQGQVTTLTSQQTETSTVGASFSALQSALQAVGSAVSGSPTAQVSGTGITATASTGALAGTYTIQVDDPGSSTVTLSQAGLTTVTDPTSGNISSASGFTLTINGVANTITPSGTSLEDLASAINSAGVGAQATIVNVGSTASPDYRLAVTGTNLGPDTIQLGDGTSSNLLDTLSPGTPALYKVNGGTTDIQSTSDQLTLSPGLTVSLLAKTTSPATITVSNSFSALQSSLSNFVSAYNATVNELQKNEGQNGGALTGDSVVYTLTNSLNQIAQYTTGSGGVSTLANLGVTLQQNGQLSFDATAFSAAKPADIQQFLGSVSSSGFLQLANNELNAITDTTNGVIAGDFNSIQAEITSDNTQVSNDQLNITSLQTNLEAQLSKADAAIATLESQKTYFAELFTATYGNGSFSTTGG